MSTTDIVAGALLLHASYTDLRFRVVRNWAVASGAAIGFTVAASVHGMAGVRHALLGLAAGGVWWAVVAAFRMGPGDAKLAMALGALLGPGAALFAPAFGQVLCALWLLPWIAWRRHYRQPWRDAAVPLAPWIAVGTVALACLRLS